MNGMLQRIPMPMEDGETRAQLYLNPMCPVNKNVAFHERRPDNSSELILTTSGQQPCLILLELLYFNCCLFIPNIEKITR